METKYTKFKFSIVTIILLILMTSVASATKVLPSDFGTQDYSKKVIKQAKSQE